MFQFYVSAVLGELLRHGLPPVIARVGTPVRGHPITLCSPPIAAPAISSPPPLVTHPRESDRVGILARGQKI